MLNYLAKSLSAVALEKIILLLVAVPVNIYMIRSLGPEQYGILSLYIVLATILFQISDFGVRNIFISEYAHDNQVKLVSTYITIKFAAAIIISAILLTYYLTLGTDGSSGYYIAICVCLLFTFSDIFESIQLNELKQTQAARIRLISGILSNLFRFLMIYAGLPPYYIIFSYGLEYAIKGLLIYKTGITIHNYNTDLSYTLKILKRALPLTLSMVFLQLYHRVDIFIIKDLMDDNSVGIYSAAMKLLDYLVFIVVVLNTVINPILGREKSGPKLNKLYQNYYFIIFWGAATLSLLALTVSSFIISSLYGPEYSTSVQPFNIMIYSLPFIFLGSVSGFWYVNNGLEVYALIRNIFGLCLNVALNYLLIPEYGLQGSAWATLISYIATSLVVDALFKKTRVAFVMKITALTQFSLIYKWIKNYATKI